MKLIKEFNKVAEYKINKKNKLCFRLPWWYSGQESTCQCRRYGFNPWAWKISNAVEQLNPSNATTEACAPRACAPQQEKPRQPGQCCLNQKKPACSNKTQLNQKKKGGFKRIKPSQTLCFYSLSLYIKPHQVEPITDFLRLYPILIKSGWISPWVMRFPLPDVKI